MPDVQRKNNLSISNLPDGLPDYATPVKPLPDYVEIVKEAKSPESSNLLDTVSKRIFEAPEFVKKGAKSIADTIDPGGTTPQGGFLETIGAIPDVARNMFSNPIETMRGGLAGMTEGAASLLSPANIATTVMPEGKILSLVNKGIGAFQGIHGLSKIAHGNFAEGIGDIGFGTLGMFGGKKSESKVELPSYAEPVVHDASISSVLPTRSPNLDPNLFHIGTDNPPSTGKNIDDLRYDLARNKFNMGRDQKPTIKDYWITDKDGKKILNPKYQPVNPGNPKAVFKGWQEDGEGGHYALYDIAGGPLDKSTVSEKSLKAAGIAIPETPKFSKENVGRDNAIAKDNLLGEYQNYRKVTKKPLNYEEWTKQTQALKDAAIARQKSQIEKPTLKNLVTGETGAIRFGSNKQAPIKPSTRNLRQPSDEVIGKLVDAIKEAGPKRVEQENLYSVERAKRIQSAEKVSTKGLPGFYEQLHELKGELPKVDFERTKLKSSEVNDLINYVTNSPYLLPYEKIRAKMGLLKMLSAKREEVPQASELKLLSEVFGKKFDDVINLHGGLGGAVSAKVANEMANLSKSVMASIDMSAPLRQGLPLIHKKEWWGAIKPMVESFGSQERFDALQASLKDREGYLLGKKSGLHLTDMGYNKEEAYASKLANLVPGVKMSERAYVGFLNKLRADTFDSLVNDAKLLGHDENEIGPAIAKYVNYATGRGDLGRLDPIAKELNTVFFSPRLISSRLTMLNPNTYVSKDIPAFVRKESLKSLLAVASFSITMNSLAHVMGGSTNLDPTNSDFIKSKFGNTRMDPNGGIQQYIVAATRLLTGETTSSTTGKTSEIGKRYGSPSRVSMMIGVGDKYNRSFMENKFSPLVGLADDILAMRTPDTNGLGGIIAPNKDKNPSLLKGSYSSDVINRFVPLMVNDMIDLYKDDPNLFVSGKSLLGAGAALGMGMQTYKPTVKKSGQMRISVR